jgi:osmoprotectant transport system substrate-binding protein
VAFYQDFIKDLLRNISDCIKIEKGGDYMQTRARNVLFALLSILFLWLVVSCSQLEKDADTYKNTDTSSFKGKITVGGKDFTEQYILTQMTSIYLKEHGYNVEEVNGMKSKVAHSALVNGNIDLYWGYTGTALTVFMNKPAKTKNAYKKIQEWDKENGLIWLNRANFNNTYAILMRKEQAENLGIKTISDLANYINRQNGTLTLGTNTEFYDRMDGIKGLEQEYGFQMSKKNVIKMDYGLLYGALKEGQVDFSVGFATDGRIKVFNLIVLKDDQSFFPAYNAAPVIRQETLKQHPELRDLLNEMAGRLNTKSIMQLNYEVDVEHKSITKAAREWLVSEQLIK